MEKIVTAEQAKKIDRYMIEEKGIPGIVLMERAAGAVADAVSSLLKSGEQVLFFCGKGNNGGDGIAAARILLGKGTAVKCILMTEDEMPADSETNRQILSKTRGVLFFYDRLSADELAGMIDESSVIVDGLFGTGLSRVPSGKYADAIRMINNSGKKTVSIDIPSGVFSDNGKFDTAVRADITVTFQYKKPGHVLYPSAALCGEIILEKIGIDDDYDSFLFFESSPAIKRRNRNTHKGTYGSLLVVSGSRGMAGACSLCASASVRTGSGLTRIVTAEACLNAVQAIVPEATVRTCGQDTLSFACFPFDEADKNKAMAIGPGMGRTPDNRLIIEKLLDVDIPKVIDADGLNSISADMLLNAGKLVITPHPKEFSRLFGIPLGEVLDDPIGTALRFASDYGIVILLKGASTVISNGIRTVITNSGTAAMAKGGSGDVLTGTIGSFLAQGMDPFEAAYKASYICGRAGELAAKKYGSFSAKASDTVDFIGMAIEECLTEKR